MKPTIVPPTKKVMLMCLGILLTAAMYPHGSCENKTNSNGGEKLKAYARANDLAFVNANWVSANYATADITASASKACAWQKSRNNAGAHSFQGEVKKNRCGRGYSKSYLASQLLDMFSGDPGDDDADVVLERCDLGMSGQTINGNVVTILGVYGYMEAAQSMISSYSIKIWLPSSPDDTIPDEDEFLYAGTLKIIDGIVMREGDFASGLPAAFYTTSSLSGFTRVNFNSQNLSISVSLPAGRGMDDIVVITESDGTGNEAYAERVATAITENEINAGQITFGVFPNPTADLLNIEFSSEQAENISVEVVDAKGQMVKRLFYGKNEGVLSLKYSTANLPAGAYQVLISGDKKVYIKKFIKE